MNYGEAMNLVQIREQFRNLSGRYDLVNDDLSDHGADFYINEGSKYLDRKVETTRSWATYPVIKQAGTWYIRFPYARAVKEVWMTTIGGRVQLVKKRLQDIQAEFYTKIPAEWTNGTPEYFSPTLTRMIPEDIGPATLATFATYIGVVPPITNDYNAIILSVPVDQEALFEIYGLFYSMLLELDADENFWSQVHPMLLIQSAIRQTYVVTGNNHLRDTYEKSMSDELINISIDLVEQIIAEVDAMEG